MQMTLSCLTPHQPKPAGQWAAELRDEHELKHKDGKETRLLKDEDLGSEWLTYPVFAKFPEPSAALDMETGSRS